MRRHLPLATALLLRLPLQALAQEGESADEAAIRLEKIIQHAGPLILVVRTTSHRLSARAA